MTAPRAAGRRMRLGGLAMLFACLLGLAGAASGGLLAPASTQLIADEVRLDQHAPIASNFDRRRELQRADVPASASPDVVGAFRFICQAGHISADDPIVYPGQRGRSHLHQFFGNTLTNADSSYESLRTTGDSTCMGPLNRSAYWMPAMLNGMGQVVRPDYVSIYYKRLPESDPACRRQGRACVPLPRGLRFIFGHDMLDMRNAPTGNAYWNCQGAGATPGHYPSLAEARRHCAAGSQIGAIIVAPDCWDGANLDSPDHRSHISYAGYGDTGVLRCPASHPFVIPQFTLGAWYTSDASLPKWHLSSDRMPGMAPMEDGTSLHSDWWGAWDDETMATWTAHCINRKLNCSDGVLGDGTGMKRPAGFGYTATPRLVRVP
ncbi:DUF1996 domain-containing protein [Sphingomonas floccifaciens]|uniref:DUF1996 domain-containing protein n=1 Tax=Sphingomonas floccifaciens TaxID=1844115 RepID=A0ABW4NF87_9SPHN